MVLPVLASSAAATMTPAPTTTALEEGGPPPMLVAAVSGKSGGKTLSATKTPAQTSDQVAMAAQAGGPPPTGVRFNEIRIGGIQSATCKDSGVVYFELSGPPGLALDQLAIIQIGKGDNPNNSGVVERVVRFLGVSMPADGLLVVTGFNFCIPNVEVDVVAASDLVTDADNNTFLLVRNTTASAGMDLDFFNNCTLDLTPWAAVMDSVAFRFAGLNNCVYPIAVNNVPGSGTVFEPQGSGGKPPLHVFRCRTSGTWVAGLDVYAVYQPGVPSAFDSPGQLNPFCEAIACPSAGKCCEPHGGLGCDDAACCTFICSLDGRCCQIAWDAQCAALASQVCECADDPFAPLCPDQPGLGDCFAAHGNPGCDQFECQRLVCQQLPFCCQDFWDQQCALTAYEVCVCGNPLAASCYIAHGAPGCNDCDCCTRVCLNDPACCDVGWDLFCVVRALFTCVACGSKNAESCCTIHQSPSCSDAACCGEVCEVFVDCCIAAWDFDCALLATQICEPCSFCGNPSAGDCIDVQGTPGCAQAGCCVRVCTVDPYCCGVAWDAICVQNAVAICFKIEVCDNIGGGLTCFEEHKEIPGCSDRNCCAAVCTVDVTCCEVGWDDQCVELAFLICSPFVCGSFSLGSCMVPSGLPGCNFAPCCLAVCAVNPNCCLLGWTSECVELALEVYCGTPGSGDCFTPNGTPFCEDKSCCAEVCLIDAFCCGEVWDQLCAEQALTTCPVPCVVFSKGLDALTGIRSCYIPHAPAGCETAQVCSAVCTIDPYCCQRYWDALCVQEALAVPGPFNVQCPAALGSCFEGHGGQGCTTELCCKAICSIDATCCTSAWDASCAELAVVVCLSGLFPFPPACPGSGNCFQAKATPSCGDQVCCTIVCQVDPSCCLEAWDVACVSIAQALCDDFLPEFCLPSIQSCFAVHESPYCRSADCSDAVCAFDSFCCETAWDFGCVTSALVLCGQGSGSLLAGECFEPNFSAGCADWACSQRVCFDDAFCCIVIWDSVCADQAVFLCREGPCFASHLRPGCSSVQIMLSVCDQLPDCCILEWDVTCAALAQQEFLPFTQKGGPGFCIGNQCAAKCGEIAAGSCFAEKLTPNCEDLTCCNEVCFSDTICCLELWDQFCVELARSVCPDLWEDTIFPPGDLCAGPCFFVKPLPNCNDEECSKLVCADDPICCETVWDNLCVEQALWACLECGDEETGDCCSTHPAPYCNDESCCDDVCAADPFCCSLGGSWDFFCVQQARIQCPVLCPVFGCGDPSTGSCFSAHPTPYCSDLTCCNFICGLVDPICCQVAWDDFCVEAALFFCP